MGSDSLFFFFLSFFLLLLSSAMAACGGAVQNSKAGFFPSLSSLSAGACGYGPMALGLSGGFAAAANSGVLRGGLGCGACLQVVCKRRRVCRSEGVKVILTDLNKGGNGTDLVLSRAAFAAMAERGKVNELMQLGAVRVQFKRTPCEYKNKNLSVRVEERSKWPNSLAIKFLFQGGMTDIVAVDVAQVEEDHLYNFLSSLYWCRNLRRQVGSSNWRFMNRVYGPIWRMSRAPVGPLQLRMVITGGYDGKWVWIEKEVLPVDWKIGIVYDMGAQINDTALI